MARLLASITALALTSGGLALAAGPGDASISVGNGPAAVVLNTCPKPTGAPSSWPQTSSWTNGCSAVFLPGLSPEFINITGASSGAPVPITWSGGSVSRAGLTFPQSGQAWPVLSGLSNPTTFAIAPTGAISGTMDTSGNLNLSIPLKVTLTQGTNTCALSGTSGLGSSGAMYQYQEANPGSGNAPKGRNWNPATRSFAAVSDLEILMTATGAGCANIPEAVQFATSHGIGLYLSGTLSLPPGPAPALPRQQMGRPSTLATHIKQKGTTRILFEDAETNMPPQMTCTSQLTWSTKRSANGHKKKYGSVSISPNGTIMFRTTGRARKLFVKLTLRAPGLIGQYQPFAKTDKWKVS